MMRPRNLEHFPFIGGLAAALVVSAALIVWGDEYAVSVGLTLVMWIALVQSWAAFSGLSGYISLGHAVFYGVGAYVMVVAGKYFRYGLAVILAGLVAGAIAFAAWLAIAAGTGTIFRHFDFRPGRIRQIHCRQY